ncbi:MAG: hypothetical protein ACI4C7_00020 [Clostridia bacterium]
MKTAYTFREEIKNITYEHGTEIRRTDFESMFTKTKESVIFSFGGWDGKSYDGEIRKARVLKSSLAGYEDCRFIKVGKSIHMIDESKMILEKATGKYNHSCNWVIDVARAIRVGKE